MTLKMATLIQFYVFLLILLRCDNGKAEVKLSISDCLWKEIFSINLFFSDRKIAAKQRNEIYGLVMIVYEYNCHNCDVIHRPVFHLKHI
jgi:hypothetical protein